MARRTLTAATTSIALILSILTVSPSTAATPDTYSKRATTYQQAFTAYTKAAARYTTAAQATQSAADAQWNALKTQRTKLTHLRTSTIDAIDAIYYRLKDAAYVPFNAALKPTFQTYTQTTKDAQDAYTDATVEARAALNTAIGEYRANLYLDMLLSEYVGSRDSRTMALPNTDAAKQAANTYEAAVSAPLTAYYTKLDDAANIRDNDIASELAKLKPVVNALTNTYWSFIKKIKSPPTLPARKNV